MAMALIDLHRLATLVDSPSGGSGKLRSHLRFIVRRIRRRFAICTRRRADLPVMQPTNGASGFGWRFSLTLDSSRLALTFSSERGASMCFLGSDHNHWPPGPNPLRATSTSRDSRAEQIALDVKPCACAARLSSVAGTALPANAACRNAFRLLVNHPVSAQPD
jgi:hypothetical protein